MVGGTIEKEWTPSSSCELFQKGEKMRTQGLGTSSFSKRSWLIVIFFLAACLLALPRPDPSLALEPKYGGTLRVTISEDPRTMDPHQETDANTPYVICNTYNSLLRWNEQMTEMELDLAESWKRIDDLTYIFKLHQGVRFHDIPPVNGRELTSEDVKYSLIRITGKYGIKEKFKQAYFFEDRLASISTPDKYTVVIKTKEPYAPLVHYLASPWCAIVPKEAVDKFGDLSEHPIGTGPFTLAEYMKGSHILLTKNPNYFKKGLPYLDKVHMKIVNNPTTILMSFIAGNLDQAGVLYFHLDTLKRKCPEAVVIRSRTLYTGVLRGPAWCDDMPLKPPFDQKKVRQAIAMAIDKPRLLKLGWGGYGTVQVGPVPNWPPYSLTEEDQVEYNPAKAKKLLAEAGYPNGFTVELLTFNNMALTAPAQAAQAMLKEVGIQTDLKILEFAQYFSRAWKFDYQMAYHMMTAGFDPEEYLVPYFGDCKKATYYKWTNKEIHRMIEEQRKIMNPEKRAALIRQIQRKIIEDAPNVFLYSLDGFRAFKPYVYPKKIHINPYQPIVAEDIWLDK